MHPKPLLIVYSFFLLILFSKNSLAQVTLSTSPYTQDFNAIGSGLPTGWTVRTGATASAPGTSATFATTKATWGSTSGNFRNVASANGLTSASTTTDQGNSTDRALAVRQVTATDVGVAFVLQLTNTSGLTNVDLSFALQSLDATSTRTATWRVDYAIGSSPTSFTTVTTSPSVLTTSPTWGATNVTADFGAALDNINDMVWIRIAVLTATTGSGNRPTSAIDDLSLAFVSGDNTPPTFTSGYPNVSSFTESGFTLFTNLSEAGKTYYVALPDGATAPTAEQVKNGQDANGLTVATGYVGSINVPAGATEYSAVVSALQAGTDYDVYVVAEDIVPNLQTSPIKLDARTNTAGDVTPPVFAPGYPIADAIKPTTFTVRTDLDELGKTYFVVLTSGAQAPSSDQVKLGQDGNAVANSFAGIISVTTPGTEFTFNVVGLTPSTNYDVYVVAEDNVPNLQPTPTKISIVTAVLFTEDFETCDSNSFIPFNVLGAQTWGCVDFGYNGTKGYRMNGFLGTDVPNEDWLISPLLNLGANADLSFYSQFSFAGNSLQLKISTDYSGSGDPGAATWTDLNANFPSVAVGSTSTSTSDWTISNVDLSAYIGQVYLAFIYTSTSTAAARWTIDNISVSNTTASYLQTLPAGLSFNATNVSKSYALKGVNLQNDVTITAPANFQVSKDNSTFASSISFLASEVVTPQTVYVNFNVQGVTANTYTGSIVNGSPGVASKNVAVTGTDKSQTFNIATYNLEFFASNVKDATDTEFGPVDDALQLSNVTTVMQTIGADIFAVEEISNDTAFNQLAVNLGTYDRIISDRWSYSWQAPDPNYPPQKTGFIFNTSRVRLVSARVMFASMYDSIVAGSKTLPNYPTGTSSSFWSSGRLPFMATFDVTVNGTTRRIRMVDIHGKADGDQSSHDRRMYDANVLRDSLNKYYQHDNIIFLGDFNDDVYGSITTGAQSAYQSFVTDTNFNVLTYALNQSGGSTYPSSSSFLDNVIISSQLTNAYVSNSITVEDPRLYINNYSSTTSDHLPVTARFLLSSKADQTISFGALPSKTLGDDPFTVAATSSSALAVSFSSASDKVTINGSNVTVAKAGRVTITASQAGNSDFNAASVDQSFCINPPQPTITVTNANTVSPTLTSSAVSGNQWYLNGTAITGATNAAINVTSVGQYKVQVQVDDCASVFSGNQDIVITGINPVEKVAVVGYPNPADDILFISGLAEVSSATCYDATGRVFSLSLEKIGDFFRSNVRELPAGLYLLRISQDGSLNTIKFIKK